MQKLCIFNLKNILLLGDFRYISFSDKNNMKIIRLIFKRLVLILLIYFIQKFNKFKF